MQIPSKQPAKWRKNAQTWTNEKNWELITTTKMRSGDRDRSLDRENRIQTLTNYCSVLLFFSLSLKKFTLQIDSDPESDYISAKIWRKKNCSINVLNYFKYFYAIKWCNASLHDFSLDGFFIRSFVRSLGCSKRPVVRNKTKINCIYPFAIFLFIYLFCSSEFITPWQWWQQQRCGDVDDVIQWMQIFNGSLQFLLFVIKSYTKSKNRHCCIQ